MNESTSTRMSEAFGLAIKVKAALKAKGKVSGWTKCPPCARPGPRHPIT